MFDITLKIDLRALPLGRSGESDDPKDARTDAFGDPLDHAALAGRISTLKNNDNSRSRMLGPELQLDQLDMQFRHFLFIVPPLQIRLDR
jgi:hypothetical protein